MITSGLFLALLGTDARRAPLPGVVHVTSEGEATITCDFSSIGGVSARRGVFNQTVWPRQVHTLGTKYLVLCSVKQSNDCKLIVSPFS